jgi:hypothetical protein
VKCENVAERMSATHKTLQERRSFLLNGYFYSGDMNEKSNEQTMAARRKG